MGGFANFIGGLGQGAQQYGQQARQLLESRRHDFADLIGKAAETETDPQTRISLLKHQADLVSGKPMGKIAQDFQGTVQKRIQDEQALHSVIGQPPQPPAQVPAPAGPGQTPGTATQDAFIPDSGQNPALPGIGGNNGMASQIAAPSAPPAPPAAQPADNPLTNPAPGGIKDPVQAGPTIAALNTGMPAQQPTPTTASPAAPPVSPISARSKREAILAQGKQDYASATPAMRPFVEFQTKEALEALAPFEQVENRIQLMSDPRIQDLQKTLRGQGYSELQIPSIIGSVIGAPVPMIPGIGNAMYTPERLNNLKASDIRKQYPGQFDSVLSGVSDDAPVSLDINKITHDPMAVHVNSEPTKTLYDNSGTPTLVGSRSGAVGSTLSDLHSAGQVAPVDTGVNSKGNHVYQSRYNLLSNNDLPVLGSGVNPSFIASKSSTTTQKPGEAPTTTTSVHTKGSGGSTPSVPASGHNGSPSPVADDPLAKRNYEDWAAGKGEKLSTPERKAATIYAMHHNLPTPDEVSAGGQKALSDIDPMIKEIQRTRDELESKIKAGYSTTDFLKDVANYKLGRKTPATDLISSLGFSSLRSGGSLMKSAGSRARQVLELALQHTPNITVNPITLSSPEDSLALMDGMLRRMQDGKAGILANEKKNSVIQPLPTLQPSIQPVGNGKKSLDQIFAQ